MVGDPRVERGTGFYQKPVLPLYQSPICSQRWIRTTGQQIQSLRPDTDTGCLGFCERGRFRNSGHPIKSRELFL